MPIGYWHGSLFSNMKTSANVIQWGGQFWNSFPGGRHTKTQMGNGHFPQQGKYKAAFFDNCLYLNPNNEKLAPYGFPTRATRLSCYDISKAGQGESGLGFYFGGPGGVGCDGL